MQLLLTDRLTCPRCGPTFGLILLADRLVDRRVCDGVLGCPNCRDSYLITNGFADLRAPPRGDLPVGLAGPGTSDALGNDEAVRVVALLGVARGPGTVALVGGPARHSAALAQAVEELQVVAVDPDVRGWPEHAGVSRVVSGPGLAFFSRTLRGIAIDGRLGEGLIAEAVRVAAPLSRVLVVHAPLGTDTLLADAGLDILAADAETVVATRR